MNENRREYRFMKFCSVVSIYLESKYVTPACELWDFHSVRKWILLTSHLLSVSAPSPVANAATLFCDFSKQSSRTSLLLG
jgi:hypothetical protein